MRILLLGGTAWLGQHIALAALARGHDVTCVARGTDVPDGVELVNADRDDDTGLADVLTRQWDAVIDVAMQPGHVRRAVRDLQAVAGRYVFVSSVSAYATHERGEDKRDALLAPFVGDNFSAPEDYGPAKVACERAVADGFGKERSVLARVGLIGGPGDTSGRTDYWPWRFAHPSGDRVVAPDAAELPTSIIDVRDVPDWLVGAAESEFGGAYDVVGESVLFPDHIALARSLAGGTVEPELLSEDWLLENGVAPWAGPRSLPLWLPDRAVYGMNEHSGEAALAAGLRRRSLEDTLTDSLRWREKNPDAQRKSGLSDDEERELLARWDAR